MASILVLAGGVEAAVQGRPPDGIARNRPRAEAVERVLAAARVSSSALSLEIDALRRDGIPAAFAALVRLDRPHPPEAVDRGPNRGPAMPGPRESIVAALGRTPRGELRLLFDGIASSGAGPAQRRAILDVVADSGTPGDFVSIGRWASPGDGVEEAFSDCVRALLSRDPRGYAYLPDLLKSVPECLRAEIVRGVATARSEHGLRTLAVWAETEPDLSLLAIVHIGRMATGLPRPIDAGVRKAVRRCLLDPTNVARPEAALAAGELDDDEAIPLLILLLDHDSRGLQANALWSLQRLSGLQMREEPERWRTWYAEEERWWREDSDRVLEDLRSGSPEVVHAAFESIAGMRTGRERLVPAVAECLASANPSVVTQACVVLGRLGSAASVPRLLGLLDHPDPAVRAGARDALRSINGFELPDARRAPLDPR